jgi:D-ribose pyranase
LNAELSAELAKLGHGHLVTIGDCGLPRPRRVKCIDLALVFGVPSFADVLTAVAEEIVIEAVVLATESIEGNPTVCRLASALGGKPEWISHDELKQRNQDSRLFVRCGEATPYVNVILRCGVPF